MVWQAITWFDPGGPFKSDKVTRLENGSRDNDACSEVPGVQARDPAATGSDRSTSVLFEGRVCPPTIPRPHRTERFRSTQVFSLWPPSAPWTERSPNPPCHLQESRVWPNLQGRPEVRTSPRFVAMALNDLGSLARCSIPPLQALRACLPSRRPVAKYARPPLLHRLPVLDAISRREIDDH